MLGNSNEHHSISCCVWQTETAITFVPSRWATCSITRSGRGRRVPTRTSPQKKISCFIRSFINMRRTIIATHQHRARCAFVNARQPISTYSSNTPYFYAFAVISSLSLIPRRPPDCFSSTDSKSHRHLETRSFTRSFPQLPTSTRTTLTDPASFPFPSPPLLGGPKPH